MFHGLGPKCGTSNVEVVKRLCYKNIFKNVKIQKLKHLGIHLDKYSELEVLLFKAS